MRQSCLLLSLALVVVAACDEGTKTKAKDTVKNVDQAIDKFDADDVKERLVKARAALAQQTDPAEECSWVATRTETEATKSSLAELRKLCTFDAPVTRAQLAVVRAETARAEQPEAPSLTECQSDDWASMKTKIEGSPYAGEVRWTELVARWAKVCPGQK